MIETNKTHNNSPEAEQLASGATEATMGTELSNGDMLNEMRDTILGRKPHKFIAIKNYPSGVREYTMSAPQNLRMVVLYVICAILSPYLTNFQFKYLYDLGPSALILHVILEGAQGTGKSFAYRILERLLKPLQELDEQARRKMQEYNDLKRKKQESGKNKKKKGDAQTEEHEMPEPPQDITLFGENISVTQLMRICDASVKLYGRARVHLRFLDEIGALVKSAKSKFSDLTQITKLAYELGKPYRQDYFCSESYCGSVDIIFSEVLCGTPGQVDKCFTKDRFEDGTVGRSILAIIESHIGAAAPVFKPLTTEQEETLDQTLAKLMRLYINDNGQMKDIIMLEAGSSDEKNDISWLNKHIHQWCEEMRILSSKTQSEAIYLLYKRTAVNATRIALILYILWIVEGKYTEKQIRSFVIKTFLAVADDILVTKLERWGMNFEEAACGDKKDKFKIIDIYDELPDRFTKDYLTVQLKHHEFAKDPRFVVRDWRALGLLEPFKPGGESGVYVKIKK